MIMELTDEKYDLTQGVIWRKLLRFFFPIAVGMLFQQLYNAVDAVIVGKFVGTRALAAVGGSPAVILNLTIGFFIGLSSGATVIISQYFGAGDRENVSRAVHTAIAFSVAAGALLTVVGWFISPWALRAVRTPDDITAYSLQYLRIFFLGTVPLLLFDMGSSILRAVGDSKSPLYYLVFCCLSNIVLDLLFVVGFHWEVAGAAWATVIAMVLSAALIVWKLCRAREAYRLVLRELRIYPAQLRHMLYIGIPAGIQSATYGLSNIIIQAAVNDLGTSIVAAWTLTSKLDGVYWSVSNSFGVAIMAFVGQNFGAGKYDRMKQSVRVCLGVAMCFTVVICALILLLGKYCFRIFVDDAAVIDQAVQILTYFVPYYCVWTFIEILSNSLRGAGDAIRPMVITLVGICGLRVLWIFLVVPLWPGIMGVSMCYPATWFITAVVFILYYRRSNWLERCITLSGEGQ
ncbi:MAG TPA: MATE family efflux transporter [Oscillospiraceae bacterium]|nr:MATE family efflux transporter [Oscillospiraceae bacterium]